MGAFLRIVYIYTTFKVKTSNNILYYVPKVIDFPRYNMKCSVENVILRGICISFSIMFSSTFHVISRKF